MRAALQCILSTVARAVCSHVDVHARPELHVGQTVALQRSGQSCGSREAAVIVEIRGDVLRLRWCDGRETFVPLGAVRPTQLH